MHHIPIACKKRNKKVDCISDGGYQREREREEKRTEKKERFKLLARKRKKNVDSILDGVYKREREKREEVEEERKVLIPKDTERVRE